MDVNTLITNMNAGKDSIRRIDMNNHECWEQVKKEMEETRKESAREDFLRKIFCVAIFIASCYLLWW